MAGERIRAWGLALFAAGLAALTLAAGASAASLKPYSLVVCALGSSETCAPNQPAAVPAGATGVPITAKFVNKNKPGTGITVGSANLTPPAGFTVSGVAPFACPSSCSANVVGNVVQLRGLAVPPGSAVTVTMSANTPATLAACTVASPCAWNVLAKQSNDFSGPPGNNLNLDAGTSTPTTVLAALEFSAQPRSTRLGQAITDTDYTPPPPAGTGGPVTVAAADANGTVISWYQGSVSVVLNSNPLTNPTPATLSGTTKQSTTGGVATFANLIVSALGNGFTLTASTSDLPPPTTSETFNVQQTATLCQPSCTVEDASSDVAQTGGIDVTASSASGVESDLVQSIDFGNWPASVRQAECGGASLHFTYQAFTPLNPLSPPVTRPISATITTTELGLTQRNFNASVSGQEICLAQASPFTAKVKSTTGDGDNDADDQTLIPAPAVMLPDGTPGYAGLEPDCGTGPNQVPAGSSPCVTSRSGNLSGGTITITDTSPTDRFIN